MLSLGTIASKIFGSSNERMVRKFRPKVEAINALEEELEALSDEELRGRTEMFRQQLRDGAKVNDLLAPAACRRAAETRHGNESNNRSLRFFINIL